MRENFGFNAEQNNPTPPAEASSESRVERSLKVIALDAIKKEFPSESVGDLSFISDEESDDGSGRAMMFSKPGSTFDREVLYRVSISSSGEVQASRLNPATSFDDTLKGKRYGKQGR